MAYRSGSRPSRLQFGAAVAAVAVSAWALRRRRKSSETTHAEPRAFMPQTLETALYNVSRAEVAHALTQLRVCGGVAQTSSTPPRVTTSSAEVGAAKLHEAISFVDHALASASFRTRKDAYVTQRAGRGIVNVVGERVGRTMPDQIVIVGAQLSCGSDDAKAAASVACLLSLARSLATHMPDRTLRLVAFTHDGPELRGRGLGSGAYAQACKQGKEAVHAMVSLELTGLEERRPVVFAGARSVRAAMEEAAGAFALSGHLEAKVMVVRSFVPWVRPSDHNAFAQQGYAAFMATDQGALLYPHIARPAPSPRQQAERLAQIAEGLLSAVKLLTGGHDA